jgi:hypothetical protein
MLGLKATLRDGLLGDKETKVFTAPCEREKLDYWTKSCGDPWMTVPFEETIYS